MREIRIVDPNNLWFTSDTHFSHKNIIRWCGRPWETAEEMDAALIQKWNEVVPKDGIIFHLGDFCFGGADRWKKIRKSLNGKIYLVMGNHDSSASQPMLNLFEKVYGGVARLKVDHQEIWLSHFPLLCWTGSERGSWNLFGHVHTMSVPDDKQLGSDFPRVNSLKTQKQYDVGVDFNNYRPISFTEIKNKLNI